MKKIWMVGAAIFLLLALTTDAYAATLTINPDSTTSGNLVTVEGDGFSAGHVDLICEVNDFRIPVNPVNGKYAYSLVKFNISNANTEFRINASPVEDNMVIKVKRFWWTPYWTIDGNKHGFVFAYDGATKTAEVTRGMPTPEGVYNVLTVTGTTASGGGPGGFAESVSMNMRLRLRVTAASGFTTVIDTHGIPAGVYTVTAIDEDMNSATATLMISLNGDVNKDGSVNAYDCVCIARYVLGIPGYDGTTLNLDAANVDGEDGITIDDARYLARYLVGLETVLH